MEAKASGKQPYLACSLTYVPHFSPSSTSPALALGTGTRWVQGSKWPRRAEVRVGPGPALRVTVSSQISCCCCEAGSDTSKEMLEGTPQLALRGEAKEGQSAGSTFSPSLGWWAVGTTHSKYKARSGTRRQKRRILQSSLRGDTGSVHSWKHHSQRAHLRLLDGELSLGNDHSNTIALKLHTCPATDAWCLVPVSSCPLGH